MKFDKKLQTLILRILYPILTIFPILGFFVNFLPWNTKLNVEKINLNKDLTINKTNNIATSKMTYGRFLEYLKMGWVNKVDFYNEGHYIIMEAASPELGNRPQLVRVEIPLNASNQLIQRLKLAGIDLDAHSAKEMASPKELVRKIIQWSVVLLIILSVNLYLRRRNINFGNQNGPMSGFFKLGKVQNKFNMEVNLDIKFEDVAGIDEAKEDFKEIVDFLKIPARFITLGAEIPRGVLLVGPPGTGKTLLAKAIAGEAGVPFLSLAGAEFVELFVGIGASRVRDAFRQAKKNAPCIIFIDEIDTVGRQRGAGIGGGNDEREQTLNQLLTELDGFDENSGIILIAATNRVEVLDAALLRPGRFDRQITINLPDVKGRIEILKVHARNKKFANNVNLENLASRTTGFSGANLKNVLNEAAILAARNNEEIITKEHLNNAVERVIAGLERDGTYLDAKSKRIVAFHEAGHAITATLLNHHDPVEKLTIVPRGQAGGLTWFTPVEDQGLISKNQIIDRIIGALGGRAAEKIVFGTSEITTGASSDINQVTNLARQAIMRFGMSSDVGPRAIDAGNIPIFMDGNFTNQSTISQHTARKIDEEVQTIIRRCEDKACELINQNRLALNKIVEILMETETMSGEEFKSILEKTKEEENKLKLK